MLELRVVVDKECAECLVYQHQESSLRGKLFIKTGDKLKLRQITIRLVSTELVDIHENSELTPAEVAASNGFLQKSTRTIGTWVVLAKSGDTHVLGVGEHQYSFEIALPKGLDGTVDTGAYRLGYELESRVEHSFVLKPASLMMTPVTLVQVPMGLNLHSDDRVSMNIVPDVLLSRSLVPEDVPLGRAVCVHADAIDQGKEFVLRHLWDSALAVRLRLARGRVFPTDAYATVDIQAVPITREYRCTRVTLRLEEISIIARPQRSQPAAAARQASTRTRPASSSLAPLRRHSVANSAMSNSSSDSVAGAARGDNAAAYAQECSAEYQNAITKVRTLAMASHTAWPERPSVSLAEFSGIASARLRLHVSAADRAHTDIRNSHIQVHHQIAYEVRYERVQAAESSDARILAVAKVYGALANANIVRRDELRNLEVVRGTLPVAVVPKKISALWGLKNIDYDNDPEDEPNAFPVPNTTESHLVDLAADVAAAPYVPSSAMLDMMHSNDGYSSSGSAMPTMSSIPTMPGMPMVPGIPTMPGMPTMPGIPTVSSFAAMPTVPGIPGIPGVPGGSYMPAAPASQPMGFNPMLMPPAPLGFGMGGPSADMNYMGYNGPSADTSYNMAYGNNAGYNPMLQQQILMFQEQQRMQQQQFFQQLTEQYGQMAVSPVSQTRTEPQNSAYTYGPAPPPPPTARSEVLLPVVQEPTSYVTNAAAIELSSVPAVVVPTLVVEPADTIIETATVSETATEAASVSDSVAPETSRPDSAADTSSAADQHLTSITAAIDHSAAEASSAPALQSLTHSQSNTAISEHNDTATGRHSPPPNYDDLLPPDYEVPANQPPPYRPMESNRSRNRMWGV
ncbi:hypothetical protein GGI03_001901 [Coemansia sp. RSA 2337]|nr:hypothetical protein H4S03_002682 [Coemansia sp. S3946]KAJ2113100.1 hypothetical protein IW146_004121 [Coemansia sp. RSA 922]KAJ2466819.1 hypothetical protein GGI03_001901 [Coemansia sp. RSA 2337]